MLLTKPGSASRIRGRMHANHCALGSGLTQSNGERMHEIGPYLIRPQTDEELSAAGRKA